VCSAPEEQDDASRTVEKLTLRGHHFCMEGYQPVSIGDEECVPEARVEYWRRNRGAGDAWCRDVA
jgi:hypothetical protein